MLLYGFGQRHHWANLIQLRSFKAFWLADQRSWETIEKATIKNSFIIWAPEDFFTMKLMCLNENVGQIPQQI